MVQGKKRNWEGNHKDGLLMSSGMEHPRWAFSAMGNGVFNSMNRAGWNFPTWRCYKGKAWQSCIIYAIILWQEGNSTEKFITQSEERGEKEPSRQNRKTIWHKKRMWPFQLDFTRKDAPLEPATGAWYQPFAYWHMLHRNTTEQVSVIHF